MLLFALKVVGPNYFHPVFIPFCGIVSSYLAVFKALYKKDFEKITLEDL